MGLFTKKQKITVDDMAMKMMLAASEAIGKLIVFEEASEAQNMVVSLGYFYGFLKLHLNGITNLNTANAIINKSIANLEIATKGKPTFENFGYKVKTFANNSSANLQYALKDLKNNPFMGMAVFYLNDLYNTNTIDISKVDVAENNMRLLYGMTSQLIQGKKIIKSNEKQQNTFVANFLDPIEGVSPLEMMDGESGKGLWYREEIVV